MAFSKSLAALSSKLRSKIARKGKGKIGITTISAPYDVVSSLSPLGQQMYYDQLCLIDIYTPTSPYYEPNFSNKHKEQLPSADAEQHHPAASLSAQQQQLDFPTSISELSDTSSHSDDATSEHHHHHKDIIRCSTPSEQLFSPSAPVSSNSSRSTRTPSHIFDSVDSFDSVHSTTLTTTVNSDDRFTELPPRIFPLRRTARVQRKVVPSSLEKPPTAISDPFATLFSGPSPSSSTHSLASLASFGDRLPLASQGHRLGPRSHRLRQRTHSHYQQHRPRYPLRRSLAFKLGQLARRSRLRGTHFAAGGRQGGSREPGRGQQLQLESSSRYPHR